MTPVLAPPVESAPRRSLAAFVSLVLAELGARGLRYCVLHTWDELPENLPSDLDMAIVAEDLWRISGVLAALDAQGYRPVQLFNYARNAYYFVFAWDEDGAIGTGAIDFITEHREDNLILTTAEELVQGRRLFRGFWIPSAAAGYRYLLSKKVLKGALSDRQARQLGRLARELGPAAATQICARLFGRGVAQQAAAASAGETLSELLPLLRRKMMRRVLTHEPWTPLWCVLTEAPRAARRFLRPTGAMIAVLGPDGAGKSTLLDTLGAQFTGAFRQHHLFHWRPGLLFAQRPSRTTDPHGQSSFGYL
ncbi:MAG TPA: hypothetical protein VFA04_24865, partial [Bryobacteraceae bacterium]|nr:hypothetical protein [Bryobacteraceae bacterium]